MALGPLAVYKLPLKAHIMCLHYIFEMKIKSDETKEEWAVGGWMYWWREVESKQYFP